MERHETTKIIQELDCETIRYTVYNKKTYIPRTFNYLSTVRFPT